MKLIQIPITEKAKDQLKDAIKQKGRTISGDYMIYVKEKYNIDINEE